MNRVLYKSVNAASNLREVLQPASLAVSVLIPTHPRVEIELAENLSGVWLGLGAGADWVRNGDRYQGVPPLGL